MSNLEWSNERGKKWLEMGSKMEAMLSSIDAPLIEALNLNTLATDASELKIADVACGTGGTTLEVLKRSPKNSKLYGFDISTDLIAYAQQRKKEESSRLQFAVCDAQNEVPKTAPYDGLVSRFGVMFFADPQKAFKNLHQWLKPSGRFSFAVWAPRKENPWLNDINILMSKVITLPEWSDDAPGPFRYSDRDKLMSLLKESGFKNIEVKKWSEALPIGGGLAPHEATDFSLGMFSTAQLLAQQTQADQKQIHDLVLDFYQKSVAGKDQVVRSQATVWIFSGQA